MIENRLRNRKKSSIQETANETISTMTNHELRMSIIGFNYDELNIDFQDKELLITFEKELSFQGKQLGNISYIVGENLYKAKQIFKKYADRNLESDPQTFVNWYTKLGLTKDQTYLFLGRYNLATSFPEYKDRIISLSDRTIKEAINKKTPDELKRKVLEGQLSTGKEIKEARALLVNQISSMLEISEAEIIETLDDKNKRIAKEIKLLRQEARELRKRANELEAKADELEKTL
jgi:hypothetical protein